MQETELKILEINEQEIRAKLDSFAEKESEDVLLKTTYFSNPLNNAVVRLRKKENKTIFTVKTTIPDKEFKVRKEIESEIKDPDVFIKQLEALDYKIKNHHEKLRTTYRYKNSEICIENYPVIPVYIEIEGPKEEIINIIEKLGYNLEDGTRLSINGILDHYNIDNKEIIF